MQLFLSNLINPLVLCFILGCLAVVLRGNLKLPSQVNDALGVYLMLAIGIRGGHELSLVELSLLGPSIVIALIMTIIIPIIVIIILKFVTKLDLHDRCAIGAHYGSVSAVTFASAWSYTVAQNTPPDIYIVALLAMMEAPAILICIFWYSYKQQQNNYNKILGEVLGGKSVIVLLGGMLVGSIVSTPHYESVLPLFSQMFPGILCLFMLGLGSTAASSLRDMRGINPVCVVFAVVWPAMIGSLIALMCGIWIENASTVAILATLAASASYIAAPAAIGIAIPQARPGIYLTMSVAITFPFNLAIGIPLYYSLAYLEF